MSLKGVPCCGYTNWDTVKWNPANGIIQCHNCGKTWVPDKGNKITIWEVIFFFLGATVTLTLISTFTILGKLKGGN